MDELAVSPGSGVQAVMGSVQGEMMNEQSRKLPRSARKSSSSGMRWRM